MSKLDDISGNRYGRLLVLSRGENKGIKPGWLCQCGCGNQKTILASDLKAGRTLSCGCLRNERVTAAVATHLHARRSGKQPEYNVWLAMRSRCRNPKNKDFRHYGGRGIRVCDRWAESYPAFLNDMGFRPSPKHTLDRVEVDGDYSPDNCRWATWAVQRRNTRSYIAKHGDTHAA